MVATMGASINEKEDEMTARMSTTLMGPDHRKLGRGTPDWASRSALAAVSGGSVLVRGAPGTGKSALLHHVAGIALRQGRRVIDTTGREAQRGLRFAGLRQVLTPLLDEVTELPNALRFAVEVALGIVVEPCDHLAIANSSLAVVRRAGARCPLLVLIDDAHWFDTSSTAVMGFVVRRLSGSGVGVVGAVDPSVGRHYGGSLAERDLFPPDDRFAA